MRHYIFLTTIYITISICYKYLKKKGDTMEEKIVIEIESSLVSEILLGIKALQKIETNLSINSRKYRFKQICNDKEYREKLFAEYESDILDCYIRHRKKKTNFKDMIKETRKELFIKYPFWVSWDTIRNDLMKVKKELEPKRGQLRLFL